MFTDIRLQQFRSYTDASFELNPGVNIIVGPNASGKTNLLEAILVLARGTSYRAELEDLLQFGAAWARLDAHTSDDQTRTFKVQLGPPPLKRFEVDGQSLQRLTPARTVPVVLFEPNHLLLLTSSPDLRRSFLDDLIEQTEPRFGSTRRQYRRVLAQRNALLKRGAALTPEQLFVWNIRLSELGGQIANYRHALLARLNQDIAALYSQLASANKEVRLHYHSKFAAQTYESALLRALEADFELDRLRGFTRSGAHRDDLHVLLDGHVLQESASRGETRTLVLALKILETRALEQARDHKPLLLLDDVFSELDGKRRQALTEFLQNYQTFITTTDADVVVQHFSQHSTIIPITGSN